MKIKDSSRMTTGKTVPVDMYARECRQNIELKATIKKMRAEIAAILDAEAQCVRHEKEFLQSLDLEDLGIKLEEL
jgi:hypothetical protein